MSATLLNHETAIFERLLVSPQHAEAILGLGFGESDRQRLAELRERNNQQLLTADERAEMEAFARIGTFLAILQSKARQTLKQDSDATGAA